jgi:proteasome lid subunit RPN8/RPN11
MEKKLICLKNSVFHSILDYSKICFPKEGILILKGKANRKIISVDEIEIPPLSIHGYGFSNFPLYMLPIDFSVVGTAHSHPSGFLKPSVADLNNFYGKLMIITNYPYLSEKNIAVFDKNGKTIKFNII